MDVLVEGLMSKVTGKKIRKTLKEEYKMKPVVREYSNDETLQKDVEQLKALGVAREDIYVLSHDDDRTERIANNADANTIGSREVGLKHAVGNIF
ncbi:hypothetical protein BsIDN1_13890 [Bacillus safensis]|uniref:General stress protein 17M-like domain-containing protein n=1 Tax=Bacillus safensis TaxID=561879 RepID=A0A5S9M486_BACIA|nr:hypothetical protein BsIDN1_13890 [Bacillus safensis]